MKESVKNLWVEALRSGEFKQGTGELKNSDNAYCCLGVLCEIYSKEMKRMKKKAPKFEEDNSYLNKQGVLPEEVMKWSGMNSEEGSLNNSYKIKANLKNSTSYSYLITLNDDGASFKRIAQIIEKEYKNL
jgi:hypothetical protein